MDDKNNQSRRKNNSNGSRNNRQRRKNKKQKQGGEGQSSPPTVNPQQQQQGSLQILDNRKPAPNRTQEASGHKNNRRRPWGQQQLQRKNNKKRDNDSSPSPSAWRGRGRRPRKREQQQQREAEEEDQEEVMVGIEEQLQKQREEQRKRKESSAIEGDEGDSSDEKQPPPDNLGNYVYDRERKTYFPSYGIPSSSKLPSLSTLRGGGGGRDNPRSDNHHHHRHHHHSTTTTTIPPLNPSSSSSYYYSNKKLNLPALSFLEQTNPYRNRRSHIRDAMVGRILFNSTEVVSSFPHDLRRDSLRNTYYNYDGLSCKVLLHPSCRTFDVVAEARSSQQPLFIATITEPDKLLFSNYQVKRLVYNTFSSIRQIPLASSSSSSSQGTSSGQTYVGVLSLMSDNPVKRCEVAFSLMDARRFDDHDEDDDVTFQLGSMPYDFCLCKNHVVMTPTPATSTVDSSSRSLSSSNNNLVDIPMIDVCGGRIIGGGGNQDEYGHQHHCSRRCSFPELAKSDAFCIESAPVESNCYGTCCVGYRNGQIALMDPLRTEGTYLAAASSPSSTTFGSVTSLSWLTDGNHILARGSFGDCHLYDVRRICNSNTTNSFRKHRRSWHSTTDVGDPSLLWKLSAPASYDSIRSKIALYCNGMAVDPTQSIAIAPLLTPCGEDPCFGFWSLNTGKWIGSKVLHPNNEVAVAAAATEKRPPPFLELCPTTTPSYMMSQEGEITNNPLEKNRFGLWFKCGRSVAPTTDDGVSTKDGESVRALTFCNIHHMTVKGSCL